MFATMRFLLCNSTLLLPNVMMIFPVMFYSLLIIFILMFIDMFPGKSFQKDLGQFAGKHVDPHDSPCGFTCMITDNDLQEEDLPGIFVIGDLGVGIGKDFVFGCSLTVTSIDVYRVERLSHSSFLRSALPWWLSSYFSTRKRP